MAAALQQASPGAVRDENNPALRTYYNTRLTRLDQERLSFWNTWRDIASQMAPRRGRFLSAANDTQKGARRDNRIIDNTPLLSARIMASGMMAGISSPARPWFRLKLADADANKDAANRAWLDEVQKRILEVFARSNLYNALHTLYGELGTFGTAALWVDEDEEDVVRGYTLTAGEYWLASSRRQAVDTLYRSMWWTVRQIVDSFGREKCSAAVLTAYDNGQLDLEFEIVHAIEPNPRAAPKNMRQIPGAPIDWTGHLARNFVVRSVWFERALGQGPEGNVLLRESGYEEFPAMCPRWEVAGSETYGSGPGWVALGDSQQLQTQQRRKQEAIDKSVKPPMVGPPSLRNEPASLLPGGITYLADPNAKFESAMNLQHLPPAIAAVREDIMVTQDRIKKAFYADLFLMMAESDRREVTAREIDERHEEKMLMLGPVLERLHDELHTPLVERVYAIMARNGLIPAPPQGMRLDTIQVEFISILAQAQKAVSSSTVERYVQFAAYLAGVGKPEAMDRVDADNIMDDYADMTGVPSNIVVAIDEARKIRDARAKATAEHNALETGQRLADIGETASKINVGGGASAAMGGQP